MLAKFGQETNQFLRPFSEKGRGVITSGGALAGFAQGGIGGDGVGNGPDLQPVGNGQHPGLDKFACMGPEDVGAKDVAFLVRYDFYQPGRQAFGLGAIVFRERPAQDTNGIRFCFCFALALAHMGKLGRGVGDPGHICRVGLCRQAKQHVSNDNSGMVARHMGKLRPAGNVTDGIDPSVRRAQAGVYGNAFWMPGDAGRVQAQALDIHLSTGGDKKVGRRNAFFAAVLFFSE